MHRESVYVCTYPTDEGERVAHVRAWDAGEAAELFARELEVELGAEPGTVPVDHVRVGTVSGAVVEATA